MRSRRQNTGGGVMVSGAIAAEKKELAVRENHLSQTLLGNPKAPLELRNPNIRAEENWVYFFRFFSAKEIVCPETKVFTTIGFG